MIWNDAEDIAKDIAAAKSAVEQANNTVANVSNTLTPIQKQLEEWQKQYGDSNATSDDINKALNDASTSGACVEALLSEHEWSWFAFHKVQCVSVFLQWWRWATLFLSWWRSWIVCRTPHFSRPTSPTASRESASSLNRLAMLPRRYSSSEVSKYPQFFPSATGSDSTVCSSGERVDAV